MLQIYQRTPRVHLVSRVSVKWRERPAPDHEDDSIREGIRRRKLVEQTIDARVVPINMVETVDNDDGSPSGLCEFSRRGVELIGELLSEVLRALTGELPVTRRKATLLQHHDEIVQEASARQPRSSG
jgi:hypothetical protein